MSNAMRLGKRTLAGVAAGALALGMITVASATSATAAPKIKTKASLTGTVSPVRYTGGIDDSTLSSAPAAYLSWSGTPSFAAGATVDLIGTNAAGGTGQLALYQSDGSTLAATALTNLAPSQALTAADFDNSESGDDSTIRLKAGGRGTYQGRIYNGEDTVSFSFTTAGAPTQISLTPATQTSLIGGTAVVTATVLDVSNNPTQLAGTEGYLITRTTSGTTTTVTTLGPTTPTEMVLGSADIDVTAIAAGTTTVAAAGTGPLVGQTASASITGSGTVSDDTVASMSVTCTSGCWNEETTSKVGPWNAQIKTGAFTTLQVAIDDTTLNTTSAPLRFKVSTGAGTVTADGEVTTAGGDPIYVQVTPSAGKASLTLSLGGGAGFAGNSGIVIQQVDVADAALGGTSNLTIVPVNPASQLDVSLTPSPNAVAKIGDPTSVAVTIDDSFGEAAAGQFIGAYLGSTIDAATLLSSAVTNAAGEATLTVACSTCTTNNSTQLFSFSTNGTAALASPDNLTVTYTTTGEIASLSVTSAPAATPNPITDTTTTITTAPLLTVPYDGSASSTSAELYTVATGAAVSGGTAGEVAQYRVSPSTATAITATVPLGSTGIYVSKTASTAWDEGLTSVTVNAEDTVYVFGTKVGTYDITFTGGGKSVTAPVKVQTSANAAYNVAISPEEQNISKGAIGTATVKVTDVFGNPVQTAATGGTGDDTGWVTVGISGDALLAGSRTQDSYGTNASGEATVTIIAGNAAGTAALTVTPKTGTPTAAWQTGYTPPTNAPAPVTSGAASVLIADGPVPDKELFITAYRSGAANVVVDGDSVGFERRDIITLQTRTYNNKKGKWRPWKDRADVLVKADGSFGGVINTTAKVRVRAKAGDVISNNLVVPKQ